MTGSGPVGWRFESSRGHNQILDNISVSFFLRASVVFATKAQKHEEDTNSHWKIQTDRLPNFIFVAGFIFSGNFIFPIRLSKNTRAVELNN